MRDRENFCSGRLQTMQALDDTERTKGTAKAKSTAMANIAYYIRTVKQTYHDYDTFFGAVD